MKYIEFFMCYLIGDFKVRSVKVFDLLYPNDKKYLKKQHRKIEAHNDAFSS